MPFTVSLRHGVARGLKDHAANRCRSHCEEDDRRRVICDDVVPSAHRRRRHEVPRQPKEKKIESACGEYQEAGKDEQVQGARNLVARMLPLPEPEFRNPLNSHQRPVETKIALAPSQRRQAFDHDVCETGESENLYESAQKGYGNPQEDCVPRTLHAFEHGALYLRLAGLFCVGAQLTRSARTSCAA